MITCLTASAEETGRFGAALSACLAAGDTVFLRGDLGTGKSVLARGIARGLGVTGNMPSPTFTLMQPYEGRCPVYHFDLYRLDDADSFYEAGLDEYLGGSGVAIVEWPDIADADPLPRVDILLERTSDDDGRRVSVTLNGMDGRAPAVEAALSQWREIV